MEAAGRQNITRDTDVGTSTETLTEIFMPIVIAFGVVGNIMVIVLLSKTMRRRLPSHTLLVALAVVDILFLLSLLSVWLNTVIGWSFPAESVIGCKVLTFLSHMTDCAGVWLIVLISTERAIVLFWPFHRRRYCTIGMARKWSVLCVTGASLVCVWLLVFATPQPGQGCAIDMNSTLILTMYEYLSIVDTFVSCLIPTAIILVLNVCIIVHLRQYYTRSVSHGLSVAFECANAPNSYFVPVASNKVIRRSEQQLTISLMIVTTIYIVMNLPTYLMRLISSFGVESTRDPRNWWVLLAYVLYNAHHAINFYLYTFFGPGMRQNFWKLCKRGLLGCITCECLDFCFCGTQFETY